MPANSFSGTRIIVADVDALDGYGFARTDAIANVRNVPGLEVGTTLNLPPRPEDGEWYAFQNSDGSCSPASPIRLVATGGNIVSGGTSGFDFVTPFAWCVATYSTKTAAWQLFSPMLGGGGGGVGLIDVDHVAAFTFQPGQTYASVRNIPGGGTTLHLPTAPGNGDTYEFSNEDGSAGVGTEITVDAGAFFIRGAHTFVSTTAFVWGRLTFDSVNGVWCLQQGA